MSSKKSRASWVRAKHEGKEIQVPMNRAARKAHAKLNGRAIRPIIKPFHLRADGDK